MGVGCGMGAEGETEVVEGVSVGRDRPLNRGKRETVASYRRLSARIVADGGAGDSSWSVGGSLP